MCVQNIKIQKWNRFVSYDLKWQAVFTKIYVLFNLNGKNENLFIIINGIIKIWFMNYLFTIGRRLFDGRGLRGKWAYVGPSVAAEPFVIYSRQGNTIGNKDVHIFIQWGFIHVKRWDLRLCRVHLIFIHNRVVTKLTKIIQISRKKYFDTSRNVMRVRASEIVIDRIAQCPSWFRRM